MVACVIEFDYNTMSCGWSGTTAAKWYGKLRRLCKEQMCGYELEPNSGNCKMRLSYADKC